MPADEPAAAANDDFLIRSIRMFGYDAGHAVLHCSVHPMPARRPEHPAARYPERPTKAGTEEFT